MAKTENKYITPRSVINTIYYLFPLFVIGVAFYLIPQLYHLVIMTFLAFLFSYLIRPAVEYLEMQGFSRSWSTTIIFLLLILVITVLIVFYSPLFWRQAVSLKEILSEQNLRKLIYDFLADLEGAFGFLPRGTLQTPLDRAYQWILSQLTGFLINLYLVLQYMVVIPFIAFFLVRDQREMEKFFLGAVPNMFFEMVYNIYFKVDRKIGQYMRGLAIEAAIIALLSVIGLKIFSVPYATTIGIFVGIANVVPYIGPAAGAIPAIIVKLMETENVMAILTVGGVMVVVQVIDNIFVKPYSFSQSMNLHPLIVILVVIGGGQLAGIVGMILGIPVAASVWVIVREFSWAVNNYRFER